jgi:tetratricopeptide (TPR) repeat protein
MAAFRKTLLLLGLFALAAGAFLFAPQITATEAQTRLTYPEVNTALQTKLPNQSFKTKADLIAWLILQVKQRKIDKPLTDDREDDLRQAGATGELIDAIRENSPPLPTPVPTATPRPTPVPTPKSSPTPSAQVEAALRDAEVLRRGGDCTRAIPAYTNIISIDSRQSKAFYGRGMCHLTRAKYDLAIQDLGAASKLDPANGTSLFFLGVAYEYSGNIRSGIASYGQAVSVDPQIDGRPLTSCLYIDRRPVPRDEMAAFGEKVIGACNSLVRGPDYLQPLIYMKRGIGYRLKGDYDRAIDDFETAFKLNTQFAVVKRALHAAYNSRGLINYSNGENKKAYSDVTRAIEIEPSDPTPYVNRCVINLYGFKEEDRAIEDCTSAINLTGKSSSAYNHRGYAFERKGNIKQAVADYRMALQIDPTNQAAKANLQRLSEPSLKRDRRKP